MRWNLTQKYTMYDHSYTYAVDYDKDLLLVPVLIYRTI